MIDELNLDNLYVPYGKNPEQVQINEIADKINEIIEYLNKKEQGEKDILTRMVQC